MKTGRFWLFVMLVALLSACIAPIQAPSGVDVDHGDHADHAHPAMGELEQLGEVDFPVSCTLEAQAEFNRGMALLHSFWFAPAIDSFNAVIELDPTCVMAHWGVAMSLLGNPFGWPLSDNALTAGWAAVERAQAIGAQTPREQAYIDAIAAFYRDSATVEHRTRALAYEQAMEQLAQAYPEDLEAQIFYALALNATALTTDKTYANQLKAVAILEPIFVQQPDHPGVAHYLIHSNDYPALAEEGLAAAQRYAAIAPSAPHALHMPSHIFTRLGYWQESIETNRASAEAAYEELTEAHVQGAGSYNALHAMDYLMYAHLQLGQDQAAKEVLDELYAIETLDVEVFTAAYAFAAIPARYALERNQWADAAALTLHPPTLAWERFPQAEAVLVQARGLGAARSGDVDAARQEVMRLQELHQQMLAANLAYWAGQTDIQILTVEAWIALAEDENEEALTLMRQAAEMEAATEKHPVTPGPPKPAYELLGEMLLALDEPELALAEFEISQQFEPNRFMGLYGAAHAAELAGDAEKAHSNYEQLIELAAEADSERPEVAAAHAFLAQQ
jgi:tetratricopeptide (TPR) repeat protein